MFEYRNWGTQSSSCGKTILRQFLKKTVYVEEVTKDFDITTRDEFLINQFSLLLYGSFE